MTDLVNPSEISADSPPEVLQAFIWERVLDMTTTGAADDRRVEQAGLALVLLKKRHPDIGAVVETAIRNLVGWAQDQIDQEEAGQ